MQIFEVLRDIGKHHQFSAGLLVGGKKEFRLEQSRVSRSHILVATPGRLLQHLEQTPGFDDACSLLQVLVLDEADRILDLGFQKQLYRILEYLPDPKTERDISIKRQTMLFSATQHKNVRDLAKLSLVKPEYIGVHDKDDVCITPERLQQSMLICTLPQKLDVIYSFIKSHLKKKTIVFFSSCSQVRYAYEIFCSMQPGIPLMSLHGRIKQVRRTHIYFDFLRKPHAVLFATDVAARGLDFPKVDWVVQADAPEDKEMYIHRVGRTARYTAGGRSLLCLLPSEFAAMNKLLTEDNPKIPIKKLSVNPTRAVSVTKRAAAIVASDPEMNRLAKKAFQSYLRSVYLMPNKEVFNLRNLPLDEFAMSLGLASTPSARFLKNLTSRENLRESKNGNKKLQRLKEQIKAEKLQKRVEKYSASAQKSPFKKNKNNSNDDGEEDELLVVKERHQWVDDSDLPHVDVNKATIRHSNSKRIHIDASSNGKNKRTKFTEDGEEVDESSSTELIPNCSEDNANSKVVSNIAAASEEYMKKVQKRLEATAQQDDDEAKARIQAKHRKKRFERKVSAQRATESNDETGSDEVGAVLLGGDIDQASYNSSSSIDGSSSNNDDSDSDSSDDNESVGAQEDLALELLRRNRS